MNPLILADTFMMPLLVSFFGKKTPAELRLKSFGTNKNLYVSHDKSAICLDKRSRPLKDGVVVYFANLICR
ncbi:hypothetical protein A8708_06035 [Paenibacillus oryzisoli]|uniref:Uncharacterized protein n=1 Tax=Paenibacillus oryzisoli TaxID=1850517 RepID=A0A198AQX0_9BACL|nr:hypothetical protein A8708_06035 [Paenibacillus oryzisoli]